MNLFYLKNVGEGDVIVICSKKTIFIIVFSLFISVSCFFNFHVVGEDETKIADISVNVIVNNEYPELHEQIHYTITVENLGPDNASNLTVIDTVPWALSYVSHTSSQGDYDSVSGIWNIGMLEYNSSAELTLVVTVEHAVRAEKFTQFALVLDGSGSISSADWDIMRTGLANAIEDSSIFPHDGSVELTVIQFGVYPNYCSVEIPPTIVKDDNYQSIANTIRSLSQGKGGTPMAAGIYLTSDAIENSANFNENNRQIINLVTDGEPTYYSYEGEYFGRGDGYYVDAIDKQTTVSARNYLVRNLDMNEDQDEFDALAVGFGPDVAWLNSSIVWPSPGYIWDDSVDAAPPGPGWVSQIGSWVEFQSAIGSIFEGYFDENIVENCAELEFGSSFHDPFLDNNKACAPIALPIDYVPPETVKKVGFPHHGKNDSLVTSSTVFNLTSSDVGIGVSQMFYRMWCNGTWTPTPGSGEGKRNNFLAYNGNFSLIGAGVNFLEYYSVDRVGNTEEIHNQTHIVVNDSEPYFYSELPTNGTGGISRSPMLQISLWFHGWEYMDVFFEWKNHTGEWAPLTSYDDVGTGTYSYNTSGNDWLWGNTTYTWSVNVTDGIFWSNTSYTFTTGGSRFDVNADEDVDFIDAGLVWVHRTSKVLYDGLYDVNQDGNVNFIDAGKTWVNRD
jgi:uncharacterized repeat protein (TIGR01451 family)